MGAEIKKTHAESNVRKWSGARVSEKQFVGRSPRSIGTAQASIDEEFSTETAPESWLSNCTESQSYTE